VNVAARVCIALIASALGVGATAVHAQDSLSLFPHDKHARMFPLCTTCHAGVTAAGQSVWPEPARCESCHDGVVRPRVTWTPREGPRSGNRRFAHDAHQRAAAVADTVHAGLAGDCSACHNTLSESRMAVRPAVIERCLDCHRIAQPHVDAPSEACAKCHVPLTDAPSLTRAQIAAFAKPRSHLAADFALGGHGSAAVVRRGAGNVTIAASCATCHARNICLGCHVDAPESPVIRALALDERSPAYAAKLAAPATHGAHGFLRTHASDARRGTASCAACHTRQSCTACHSGVTPRAVMSLPVRSAERAVGAQVARKAPPSHTADFREGHGGEASASPATCEACHSRATCLSCHRPDGAAQERYHPASFLTRHPSAAYARASDCGSCHNAAQFCQSCHERAGLVATARIGRKGFHDAFRGFSLGHGQAARQSLESCASCHAERDCTACHSAVGAGFRFNPHGPGFNAARMRAKNPSVCVACHGRVIPGG
jgi:hypothetical protein